MMESGDSGHGWRWMILLGGVVAAVMFFLPLALDTPLLDPDEGLHASIAQEMVERDDWVTPRLLGEAFLDKPIFYFWAQALSLRLFGMHEAAVRLPGLMFGLLGALATAAVGWRLFGRNAGLLSGLFYATMILPITLPQAAAHDVALVPCVSLAVLLFWESDRVQTRRAAILCTLAVGFLLGLAILTKGLAGVALVGVGYGTYLLAAHRLTVSACVRGAAALAVAGLVASPWYILMEASNPGYNYYYFVERHLLGFATRTQTHGNQPWWYYLPILLVGGLPWIAYFPATLRELGWGRNKSPGNRQDDATLLLWCWLIGGAAFLSIAHSKLVTYIWPLFSAIAVLGAMPWVRMLEGTLNSNARASLSRTLVFSCLAGPLTLPVVMYIVQWELSMRFPKSTWAVAILAASLSIVPLGFWLAGRVRGTLTAAMLSMSAQFAVVITLLLPTVAAGFSARELAEHFNRSGRVPDRLVVIDDRIGSFLFYLDPGLRRGIRAGQFSRVRSYEFAGCQQGSSFIVPEEYAAEEGRRYFRNVPYRTVGRWRLYDSTEPEFPGPVSTAGRNGALHR